MLALSWDCVYEISSSSSSRSSTPDKETLALASKNCFQNYGSVNQSVSVDGNVSVHRPLTLPIQLSSVQHIVPQLAIYSKSQCGELD